MAQSSSEECHGLECDVCLEHGLNKIATTYCEICEELLCQVCENVHRGMKLSRSHGLIPTSKLTKSFQRIKTLPIAFCDEHITDKIEFFCKDHSVFCCQSCKISTHRTCNLSTLAEKAKDVMNEKQFNTAMEKLMLLKSKIEKLSTTRKEHAEIAKLLGQQFIEELKELKENIFDYISKLEEKLTTDICEAVKSTTAEIQSHLATADVVLQGVTSSIELLHSYSETKDDNVMAIGCVKMSRKIEEYENTVTSVEGEIQSPNIQLHLMDMESLKTEIDSLGSISYGQNGPIMNFLDLKISKGFDINVESSWISGSVFMSSGELILCDRQNCKILLYSKDFKQKFSFKCSSYPWDVAVLGEAEIVVTLRDLKKLLVCYINENVKVQNEIKVDRNCYGVNVKNSNIYISTHDGDRHGEILVLNRTGQLQKKIGHNILSQHSVHKPFYVCVNPKEDKIYLSCDESNTVTCIDPSGRLLFQYKGDIVSPLGLYVDDKDNVLVCGRLSNNVHVVKSDGTFHKMLLTKTDGINSPYSLAYRASDGALVVGMSNDRGPCKVFMLS